MSEVTLGGDRLGSGQKQKVELHNYGMNSFNQERDWKSSMAPGILYPCFKEIGTNYGTFDIDVDAFVRTLPTKGPLFGSFKMQVDFFTVPFRIYQGILHNNPVGIGMQMDKVYLPKMLVATIDGATAPRVKGSNDYDYQVATNALLKYTGLSGIGRTSVYAEQTRDVARKFQCVPELGYYDIFKCYYSNKQEENAYVITPGTPKTAEVIDWIEQGNEGDIASFHPYNGEEFTIKINENWSWVFNIMVDLPQSYENDINEYIATDLLIRGEDGELQIDTSNFAVTTNAIPGYTNRFQVTIIAKNSEKQTLLDILTGVEESTEATVTIVNTATNDIYTADIELKPFALKNIDKMRAKLLSNNELDTQFIIVNSNNPNTFEWGTTDGEDNTGLPYSALVQRTTEGITWNAFQLNGLVVKTYQSDLFNNWLDNEFVEQIAQAAYIDTQDGGFTPDTLILAEKIYNLMNRILVSGGTYQDWQEAVYGEGAVRMCETPMYVGGMSAEIMFEEVISNSETNVGGDFQPLGSLGGKGTMVGKKGGNNIHVRMEEPGYVIGIASLTPRQCVSQGNDWDRTELDTLNDLHKPEFDQIGFQDLMVEQMAWWNTISGPNGEVMHRDSVGKQTAWINYQTAVDKCYGDFAKQDGYSFMVLNRNYEQDPESPWGVRDLTTYIDPAKYNYAFAVTDLAAQNFWVQLHFKCVSRRKMGAQQLPNL